GRHTCFRSAGRIGGRDNQIRQNGEQFEFGLREDFGRGGRGRRDLMQYALVLRVLRVQLGSREGKHTARADRTDEFERLAPFVGHAYISPFRNRSAIWPAVRAASAMIVRVGFFSELDGKTLPSTT